MAEYGIGKKKFPKLSNQEWGRITAERLKKRYGEDYYKEIGKKGGLVKGHNKGFASKNIGKDGLTGFERAKKMGRRGGNRRVKNWRRARGWYDDKKVIEWEPPRWKEQD